MYTNKQQLYDKIESLGLDSKFKENPEYDSIVGKIYAFFNDMDTQGYHFIGESLKSDCLTFNFQAENGEKASVDISVGYHSLTWTTKASTASINGEKEVKESRAHIDETGNIIIESVTNKAYKQKVLNEDHYVEMQKYEYTAYTKNGVMYIFEERRFPNIDHLGNIRNLNTDTMIPSIMFNQNMISQYKRRTSCVRNYFDTAIVRIEDKETGVISEKECPLSIAYGLKDMSPIYTGTVEPISIEKISEMLKKEDPRVASDLRNFVKDRDQYYHKTNENEELSSKTM